MNPATTTTLQADYDNALAEAMADRHNLELDVARLVRAINELARIPSNQCCPDSDYKKVKGEWACNNCGESLPNEANTPYLKQISSLNYKVGKLQGALMAVTHWPEVSTELKERIELLLKEVK